MTEMARLEHAVDYIECNLENDLDYTDIAKQAYMSSFHFQRLFSILYGCTVGEYIRNRRLALAAVEIQLSDTNLVDIAFRYRYETLEGFTRAFQRYFGIAPSVARRRKCVLPGFEKVSIRKSLLGGDQMDDMSRYSKRGYYVKENAPVYFTRDMDQTCKWFREVLGWYGDVCARNADGVPQYGCVFDYPGELIVSNLTPFRGIHLFTGEPVKEVVGFINIQGLDTFHEYVLDNGWTTISDISSQTWGARECTVTTPDGSLIRFFETTV